MCVYLGVGWGGGGYILLGELDGVCVTNWGVSRRWSCLVLVGWCVVVKGTVAREHSIDDSDLLKDVVLESVLLLEASTVIVMGIDLLGLGGGGLLRFEVLFLEGGGGFLKFMLVCLK